jgi:S-methylmethionine-dependent homocysteine/selenocysteine methylase
MAAADDGWQAKLARGELVLLDGGTGTELRRRGARVDPAAWAGLAAHEHPQLLEAIHRDYIAAGADVIVANTFAGTRFLFDAARVGELWEPTVHAAVTIARRARESLPVAVAGSISNLPPYFDVSAYPEPARECADYRALAELLAAAGSDLIALEMIQDIVHGARAFDAACATGLPVWLGLSARRHPRHGRLVGYDLGEQRLEDVLDMLLPRQPSVVNVMHSTLDAVEPALAAIRQRWSGPIGAYPEVSGITPSAFARAALRWAHAGAQLIGGCCGSTPAHIAELARIRPALQQAFASA